jgi:hypothetical protein
MGRWSSVPHHVHGAGNRGVAFIREDEEELVCHSFAQQREGLARQVG